MPWPIVNVIVALVAAYVLLRIGTMILGSFARPFRRRPTPVSCARFVSPTAARSVPPRCA
ncbi:MAG: hypothetical protein IPG97_06945 [Microthrixaceae bacterium]|nr:hypothetical protein [Microthrixaceae bacterium]